MEIADSRAKTAKLLFILVCLLGLLQIPAKTIKRFRHAGEKDRATLTEMRFAGIRAALPRGETVGYMAGENAEPMEFLLVQYVVAPSLLKYGGGTRYVIVNGKIPYLPGDFRQIASAGGEIRLFKTDHP